jgi:hypothetical protein
MAAILALSTLARGTSLLEHDYRKKSGSQVAEWKLAEIE